MDNNNSMTAVEWLINAIDCVDIASGMKMHIHIPKCFIEQAKQIEKEQHDKWNEFLDAEKVLGISDVKTIERIQWYYNKYYNKTFGKE